MAAKRPHDQQHDDDGKASVGTMAAAKYPPTNRRAAKHPPYDDHCNLDDVTWTM
jgi:hypothetical protein